MSGYAVTRGAAAREFPFFLVTCIPYPAGLVSHEGQRLMAID